MNKIERKIHEFDAADKFLGRLASEISLLLRGKHKPSFLPHLDAGDFVHVKNIIKLRFSGNKLKNKIYYHYSGYPGGLKKVKLEDLFKKNPAKVLYKAVYNMLPKNKLRDKMIKRLKVIK